MATTTSLTIDDFERLPADVAKHCELVDGELVEVSGNNPLHNFLRDDLLITLGVWLKTHRIGEVIAEQEFDFLGNVHAPDLAFFRSEKIALVGKTKRVQRFVPDLAVEIASAYDTFSDLLRKKDRYRKAGTKEVWLIAENREIFMFADSGDRILHSGDTVTSNLLPGFSITVDELFRDL